MKINSLSLLSYQDILSLSFTSKENDKEINRYCAHVLNQVMGTFTFVQSQKRISGFLKNTDMGLIREMTCYEIMRRNEYPASGDIYLQKIRDIFFTHCLEMLQFYEEEVSLSFTCVSLYEGFFSLYRSRKQKALKVLEYKLGEKPEEYMSKEQKQKVQEEYRQRKNAVFEGTCNMGDAFLIRHFMAEYFQDIDHAVLLRALLHAFDRKDIEMIIVLFDHPLMNVIKINNVYPLVYLFFWAAQNGYIEIVKELLPKKEKPLSHALKTEIDDIPVNSIEKKRYNHYSLSNLLYALFQQKQWEMIRLFFETHPHVHKIDIFHLRRYQRVMDSIPVDSLQHPPDDVKMLLVNLINDQFVG